MKKTHYVLGACAIMMSLVIGIFLLLNKPDNTMGSQIYPMTFTDLIGTRVASTTTGVDFRVTATGGYSATTTYPFALSGASEATLVFDITAASSTAGVRLAILGSNDPGCGTATTTTIYNLLTAAQVRWFDASPFLDNASVISSFTNATGTIAWENPVKLQRALHFSELNMECLSVEISASSTVLYSQYKLK